MTQLAIALTGFFVWSGAGLMAPTSTPPTTPQVREVAVQKIAVPKPVITLKKGDARVVKLTAYNAVPEQTDSTPFITASGLPTNPETIAARSVDLIADLPFGTVIALESPEKSHACGFSVVEHLIGYRVIADSMHERKRNQIDVLLDEHDVVEIGVSGEAKKAMNPARAMGLCTVEMRVIGRIPLSEVPETQAELAILVNKTFALK